jgi:hypothetical protein
MFYKLKHSWTVKNFQLVIILGLVLGISIEALGITTKVSNLFTSEVKYAKAATVETPSCPPLDQKCIANEWVHKRAIELHEQNRDYDLEQYRLEAVVEYRDILLNIVDESEYYDYDAAAEKFGY